MASNCCRGVRLVLLSLSFLSTNDIPLAISLLSKLNIWKEVFGLLNSKNDVSTEPNVEYLDATKLKEWMENFEDLEAKMSDLKREYIENLERLEDLEIQKNIKEERVPFLSWWLSFGIL